MDSVDRESRRPLVTEFGVGPVDFDVAFVAGVVVVAAAGLVAVAADRESIKTNLI